jgi:hypothetical protein
MAVEAIMRHVSPLNKLRARDSVLISVILYNRIGYLVSLE